MKGTIFKLFEHHVETHLGETMLDDLLDAPSLSSCGAFTSVGNYPHDDLLVMVGQLSAKTNIPISDLVHNFGVELFAALADGHPMIMAKFSSCLEMLAGIEAVIHRDVRKLYSDAELPRFDVEAYDGDHTLSLVYQSSRPFADLAAGLIEGALKHYDVFDTANIIRDDLTNDGTHARFQISIAT